MLRHNTFEGAIATGARICGSQNKLARRIGTNSGNLSNAKAGRSTLSFDQLDKLAEIIDDSAEYLWTLQQLARLPHRRACRTK